jgi:hypothetical protein
MLTKPLPPESGVKVFVIIGMSPSRGGDGNRTRVQGFAGPCLSHSATPPQGACRKGIRSFESGRRDSNPRPSPWQGDALPTEPRPHRTSGCDQNCSRSYRSRKLGSPLVVTPVTQHAPRTGTHAARGPRSPTRPDQPFRKSARSSGPTPAGAEGLARTFGLDLVGSCRSCEKS